MDTGYIVLIRIWAFPVQEIAYVLIINADYFFLIIYAH